MTSPVPAPRRRILVADDEPHIGRIIKTKLEQGPFTVELVYDGAEALDALDRDPDAGLLILDLMMPRVTGLEVLERVRADARFARLPCLILTAAGQDHQEQDARRRGADEFMTKPFSPKRLLARVTELVEAGR
ncbi:response regulator transcription factor [Pseudogemmatithrix spongiicola]|uniref:Response regulator transcription factor n=1 Tax=Pseudogemmatithrix spongiicola TaxID=3062599 RepID=A0AA49K032_9BACT|nr:response regulator transcription factor [Gemmatimonadaceae bacterium 'strain 138']WKW15008.1 response regulator transcription factor [Gemmatimonadaceae bacterium 'strain 318']